ncbi:unnamed protein product [Dibothriocephalus latus]|uniref:Uncharacterized protein n=1 Tax=Dibothriocephalus latus TaxID=60516 RepID=A0A3P7MDV1_DIBLA|nr:unnamed protein product [Dibothriocephalus latus]
MRAVRSASRQKFSRIEAKVRILVAVLAPLRQAKKGVIWHRKLNKLQPPDTGSSNLVQNLSSKQLTERRLRVLQHEACLNSTDTDPADFIAAVEAMVVRMETTNNEKQSIRQRATSLLTTHRRAQWVSKNEAKAVQELRTDDNSILLPANKGRSTVVINREDYNEKAKALFDDGEFYGPGQSSEE